MSSELLFTAASRREAAIDMLKRNPEGLTTEVLFKSLMDRDGDTSNTSNRVRYKRTWNAMRALLKGGVVKKGAGSKGVWRLASIVVNKKANYPSKKIVYSSSFDVLKENFLNSVSELLAYAEDAHEKEKILKEVLEKLNG